MELSQVVLFGLVLPHPERLMEPWLREVDEALDDEEIIDGVMTAMRRRCAARAGRHAGRRGAADAGSQASARLEL